MEDDFDDDAIARQPVAAAPTPRPIPARPAEPENPLAAYFRLPGLTVRLPTDGRFLPKGALTLNQMGEVEVYPMRGSDELLLKSPDALMSGLAIERMIKSCVPSLKTPHLISAPDLDVVLLAIRAASYGNTMDLEIACPKCEHDNTFDCNLPEILSTVTPFPESIELRLMPDLVISFKPHSLDEQTRLLIAAYDQSRQTQLLDVDAELTDADKQTIMRETLASVERLQNESLANAIEYIVANGTMVIDRDFIIQFLANISNDFQTAIRTKIEEVNTLGIDRGVDAKCTKCGHEWRATIEFNPSTFFAPSSSD